MGTLTDFQIYDVEFFGGITEIVEQSSIEMGSGSAGTINMISNNQKGEFERESFFQHVGGLVSRRDNTSIADVADKDMAQGELVSVKINTKIGPVAQTIDSFKKIGEDPSLMSFALGQMYGNDIVLDYLNTGLTALTTAMKTETDMVLDVVNSGETDTGPRYEYLVRGLALMGDRASRVRAWVMPSAVYFKLMENAITDKITNVADVAIYQATIGSLNRPVLVTDSPALVDEDPAGDGTQDAIYRILGLTEDALTINQSEDSTIYSEIVTGKESLLMRLQGETAHTIGVRGFEYTGGANPDDAALAAGANWSYSFADVKSGPGFVIEVN